MTTTVRPFDMSKELKALNHEKKNQSMKKLPPNTTIQRRPLHHAPVASPHAGAHVQKVVYVSRGTPVMSAVKRVKKLLQHVEKRASQEIDLNTRRPNHAKAMADLARVSEKLAKSSEEVLVKASGRAMEKALKVGEWFKTREDEMMCNVEVRTGSVAAIDDIVEVNPGSDDDNGEQEVVTAEPTTTEDTTVEAGETTLEIMGLKAVSTDRNAVKETETGTDEKSKVRKRRKRKRADYNPEDVPEARLRWVKTVEVAISLKA